MTKGQLQRGSEIQEELTKLETMYENLRKSDMLRLGNVMEITLLKMSVGTQFPVLNKYLCGVAGKFKKECQDVLQKRINELKSEFENL